MSTNFSTGESPIYAYPDDLPTIHDFGGASGGACDPDTCPICLGMKRAVDDGRAKVVGLLTWTATETHSTLRRTILDRLLGRPGTWVPRLKPNPSP